jgi:Uma2 family endonuclease
MAIGTQVCVEEYLHTSYRPDRDYVDGEVQERNLGEKDHSTTQRNIIGFFATRSPQYFARLLPEQRVQVKATRFRIPDICILGANAPDEQIICTPPMLCIEVLSPEDRMSRDLDRVHDYFEMGVPACWIVDRATRQGWIATPSHLDEAEDGVLRFGELETPAADVLE